MTRILALDVASSMGVCDWEVGKTPVFYTIALGGDEDSGHEAWVRKCRRATSWMADRLLARDVDYIVIEAPVEGGLSGRTNANTTAIKFLLLGSLIGPAALRKKIKIDLGRVQTVRKHFIGHGNMKGEDGKRAVRKMCRAIGWEPNNYDESDAGALAHWYASRLGLWSKIPEVAQHYPRKDF